MRRRRSGAGDAVTLFPFLAVLICTMGSLIVLLVVVVQQARATAVDRTRQRAEQRRAAGDEAIKIQQQVDDLRWRIEMLHGSRQQTAQGLRDRQTELSYIEDEVRSLRDRLKRAAEEAAHIKQLVDQNQGDHQASHDELNRLREQLDYSRESLEQVRRQFLEGQRSYALVPYRGTHGTSRRPIFVECVADRVILQPEGIELFSDDFQEPMTDENALAAALRAQREYFADATNRRDEPPYPLIIVRPDGAHSYAAARAAMRSWDAEFGYELVDDEMKLAFPKADAALVDRVQKAVDEARARRRLLQSMAPARFGRRRAVYTASRDRGFVAQDRSAPETDRRGASPQQFGNRDAIASIDPSHDIHREAFGSSRQPGPSFAAGDPVGLPNDPSRSLNGQSPNAATRDLQHNGVGNGSGGSPANPFSSVPHREHFNPQRSTATGPDDRLPNRQRSTRDRPRQEGPSSDRQQTGEYPPTEGESDSGRRGPSSGTPGGANGRPKRDRAAGQSNARSGGSAADSPNSPASGSGNRRQTGTMTTNLGASGFADDASSLAETRGRDWGLPNRIGTTGITRPVNLAIDPDRLIIFPEDPRFGRPIELQLDGSLRDEVDQLVAKIWKRMETWGIAGPRMYWRPVLQIQVQSGGDRRYAELADLLEDSGFVLKRK